MICLLKPEYIKDVVNVHLESFSGFFLTFLGKRFLTLFYKGVIREPTGIGLVYLENLENLENNKVIGFVVGMMNPSGFYSRLLRRDWFRFGIASIPAVLKKPKSVFRLLRALTRPSTTPKDPTVAELSSIAVLPEYQSKGIGKNLVNAFIQEVKKREGKFIYLTTDACNNEPVNYFYQKIGFKLKRSFETPEKRKMNEYWYEIC